VIDEHSLPWSHRLLDAATAEFAAHGIAGARIDRISANAQVNKAQIYKYYRSKDELFDAVFDEHIDLIVDIAPATGDDLPGFAVRLYDAYLIHPEVVRLATWARLERTSTGDLYDRPAELDATRVKSIKDAQAKGIIDPSIAPHEVLAIVTAMSMTWSPASAIYAAGKDEPKADHDRRRKALALAVRRAFAPSAER
jgi:AcrR family transcriptional regulator